MYLTPSIPKIIRTEYKLNSSYLKRTVSLEFFVQDQLVADKELNMLLLNDGQDVEDLELEQTLIDLYARRSIDPVVVVAITASSDRVQEYGVAGIPDSQGRGARSVAYTSFIVEELLPFIESTLKRPINGRRAFAGFSLGGLSAFDIAWNNDQLFDVIGVFSGSFWWRKKDLNDGYQESDRIMQAVIRNYATKPDLKFWLMAGTEDEKSDRNRNFIIDSIDDTIDVIKELLDKGYERPADIVYYESVGGEHNVRTWAKVFPAFLCWTFSRKLLANLTA